MSEEIIKSEELVKENVPTLVEEKRGSTLLSPDNPHIVRASILGSEKVYFYDHAKPEKCQNIRKDGLPCPKEEHILYPHNGKKYCFFCYSVLKYYSDNLGFEKGKEIIIGKKVVKKNAFFSKAEKLFQDKKIEETEWNDFKTLYTTNKKKARRFIKKIFKTRGL